jgi:hypothetical protein
MMNKLSLSTTPTNIKARQISEADVKEVVPLITRGFGSARTQAFWENVFACLGTRSSPAGFPKYGYALEIDGKLVGILILIFSSVWNGGVEKIRCNVSSWYVDPAYRSYASMLASLALKFKNVTVINVSAALHTHAIHEASGFVKYVDGIFAAIPILSRPAATRVRILDAKSEPDAPFERHESELLREHAGFGCTSFWCVTPERAYPFVFRSRTVKKILPCAQLIYCSSVDDFVKFARPIGLHLARRMQTITLLDANGPVAGLVGKYFADKMPKLFHGPDRPRLGDLAYTETAMFGV